MYLEKSKEMMQDGKLTLQGPLELKNYVRPWINLRLLTFLKIHPGKSGQILQILRVPKVS